MLCVAAGSLGLYPLYGTPVYTKYYWPVHLVTTVAGCAVVLEILTLALASYAGAARFLRRLCMLLLGAVVCYGWARVALGGLNTAARTERDLRLVEAVFLAAMLLVANYYSIRLGRNLKGLILGFGGYVGISLIALSQFIATGPPFLKLLLGYLQTGAYVLALVIWTVALWSYAPNPVPERRAIEPDYEILALQTRERLKEIGDQLKGTARP
jgi:hypothetical protein